MENTTEGPQKTENRILYDPAILLLGPYLEKTLIRKDNMEPSTHCSAVCNSQDMEAT